MTRTMQATPTAPATLRDRLRALRWWALALTVLLAGYADLVVGGTTLSPVLLAVGYVVLIPLALVK